MSPTRARRDGSVSPRGERPRRVALVRLSSGARPCLVHESSGPAAADAGARRRGESHPPAGLGLDPAATPPAFLIAADPATERRMETLLGGNRSTPLGSLVGVNSGSSDAGQRWPTEAFRRLGDELAVRLDARSP